MATTANTGDYGEGYDEYADYGPGYDENAHSGRYDSVCAGDHALCRRRLGAWRPRLAHGAGASQLSPSTTCGPTPSFPTA